MDTLKKQSDEAEDSRQLALGFISGAHLQEETVKRSLLFVLIASLLSIALAACGEDAAPETRIIEVPKEIIVEREVIREVPVVEVVEKEVVKTVEVPGETVIVEKEVQVIKTVEVPVETIREVVKVVEVPTTLLPEFGEAPQLAQLVAAGKLPPVAERVGEDPLVLTGQEIGRYGGSLRRVYIGTTDQWNYGRMSKTSLLRWTLDGGTLVPGVAKAWEPNSDASEWTFQLRKGMKWSDGMPFTAADFEFQFNEVLYNDELLPAKPAKLEAAGKLAKLEVIDDFTVKFIFDVPNSLFGNFATELDMMRGGGTIPYVPAHYMKQFHAKFAGQAAVDKMAKDNGFDSWTKLYLDEFDMTLHPERPTTRPWQITATIGSPRMIAERNAFFYAIDRAGNQLPYVDRLVFELVPDRELIVLKVISGEIDMQGRWIQFKNFPVMKENEDKGDYSVLQYGPRGLIQAALKFNLTYDGPEREYLTNKDFRIALSHAINREEINDILFYGLGSVRNHTAPPGTPTFPGDKYAKLHTEYDVAMANEMLDKILPNKDGDGCRLMSNGDALRIKIATYQYPDNNEMVAANWNAVGVCSEVDLQTRSLCQTRQDSNKNMVTGQGTQTLAQFASPVFTAPWAVSGCDPFGGTEYARWNQSDGAEGMEPPDEIKALLNAIKAGRAGTQEDRDRLGKEIGIMHAENQWIVSPVAAVPNPFIVNKNLANVAEQAASVWTIRTPANVFPEVFFFRK